MSYTILGRLISCGLRKSGERVDDYSDGGYAKMKSIGIGRQQYTRLLGIFVRSTRQDVNQLRSALTRGDSDKASRTAHHIKGAAEGLELGEIAHHARTIESRICRPDKSPESVRLCDEMDRQLTSISRQFGIVEE
jgi:HPt (histidine-containing phosphotransfer) domain-containing protein